MFTSFTGSSRRPRQVNLSGRKTNPFGPPGAGAGSQAALDRAQQERAQRQRERDTLNAAKKIQRVWRGHASRKTVADQLRQEWDAVESVEVAYERSSALSQLQRLLRFASTRNEQDLERIQHFGSRLQSLEGTDRFSDAPWPSALLGFEKLLLAALQRRDHGSASWGNSAPGGLVSILGFVATQIPSETSQNAKLYYRTLAETVSRLAPALVNSSNEEDMQNDRAHATSSRLWDLLLHAVLVPLKTVTGYTLDAYEAFGHTFLVLPALNSDSSPPLLSRFRDSLAESVNYKLLANALATSLKTAGVQVLPQLTSSTSRLRLLGSFIYFHRYAHNFNSPEAYAIHQDFVTVVSLLLNSLPISILGDEESIIDLTGDDDNNFAADRVTQFLKDQVQSLVNQEGIGGLLAGSSDSLGTSEEDKIEEARQLANYALALLRFFQRL